MRFLASRRGKILAVAAVAMLGFSSYWAIRRAVHWTQSRVPPFYEFVQRLDSEIPPDARILILVPTEARQSIQVRALNNRLYPRIVYLPPPGIETLEGSADWIREKKIDWAISLGGPEYEPQRASVRRIDGRR